MNIALVCFKYSSSKTFPQDMVRLAQELHQRGHKITLYCRIIASGSKLPPFISVKTLPGSIWGNALRAGKFIRSLHEMLKLDKPDVVVSFNRIPGADFYYADGTFCGSYVGKDWRDIYQNNLCDTKNFR